MASGKRNIEGTETPDAVSAFNSWLIARGISAGIARQYAQAIRKTAVNPGEFLRTVSSRASWKLCRNAWARWSEWRNDPTIWQAISSIRPPAAPPERQVPIPDAATWLRLGQEAWEIPGPLGAVLWILIFSGLRIGDLVGVTRDQIGQIAATGSATDVRQKGKRGGSLRRWTPGPLAAPGIARLAGSGEGWQAIWQLIGPTPNAAEVRLRARIPRPYHPHVFRHTVITYLSASGIPDERICEVTGHASPATLKNYKNRHLATPPAQTYADQSRLAAFLLSATTPKPPV